MRKLVLFLCVVHYFACEGSETELSLAQRPIVPCYATPDKSQAVIQAIKENLQLQPGQHVIFLSDRQEQLDTLTHSFKVTPLSSRQVADYQSYRMHSGAVLTASVLSLMLAITSGATALGYKLLKKDANSAVVTAKFSLLLCSLLLTYAGTLSPAWLSGTVMEVPLESGKKFAMFEKVRPMKSWSSWQRELGGAFNLTHVPETAEQNGQVTSDRQVQLDRLPVAVMGKKGSTEQACLTSLFDTNPTQKIDPCPSGFTYGLVFKPNGTN